METFGSATPQKFRHKCNQSVVQDFLSRIKLSLAIIIIVVKGFICPEFFSFCNIEMWIMVEGNFNITCSSQKLKALRTYSDVHARNLEGKI